MASNKPYTASERFGRGSVLDDIHQVQQKHPGIMTRDLYRVHGKFSERQWQKYFRTFSDFLIAAGIQNASSRPVKQKPDKPSTSEVIGDRWNISEPKTRIHTLEALLKHYEADLSLWEVERWVCNKWEVGTFVENGDRVEALVEPLYQVKATLKRRPHVAAIQDEIASLIEDAKKSARIPKREIGCVIQNNSGLMLEVNIPDIHVGKLAWSRETGYKNYDTKIAVDTYVQALDILLERVKGYKFEQIVYVIGNDMLNSDNLANQTTRGTTVDTDGRYYKTFGTVRRMVTECIEKLRLIAPVKVVAVPGNHDSLSSYHLGDSLECYFHNYIDVEIDNSPLQRKYHEFGKVFLCFQHGDKGKRTDYPLLMAAEKPEAFGRTKYREIHTGHYHQTKVEEQHGIRVRILPALCEPDAWHSQSGFVNNLQCAEAFVWSRDEGLIAQHYCSAMVA